MKRNERFLLFTHESGESFPPKYLGVLEFWSNDIDEVRNYVSNTKEKRRFYNVIDQQNNCTVIDIWKHD